MSVQNDFSLATKHHQAGRLKEAEALYREVLKTEPKHYAAIANLGVIAAQVKKYDAAELMMRRSLRIKPQQPNTLYQLGNVMIGLRKPTAAIACFNEALKMKPRYPEAMFNMGLELMKLGRTEQAIKAYEATIKMAPKFAPAYNAMGSALEKQGRVTGAINCFKKAIELQPKLSMAYNNLGNALMNTGRAQAALSYYRKSLELNPTGLETRFNMAGALSELGKLQEAIDTYRPVVEKRPQMAEARFSFTRALQNACDWQDPHASADDFRSYLRASSGRVDPFFMLSQNSTLEEQLFCARGFAGRSAIAKSRVFEHTTERKEGKIRIGYISGNFHSHPNSYLSVGLFERHDRERFELFGYSYGHDDGSAIRKRVAASFDHFSDIRTLTHEQAARKIREDGIDILIDRQGYTTRHRMGILAFKPTPIQVNYLGYPGTMGADYLDYVIADPVVAPMGEQEFYVEKLVHMPHCYQSTDDRQDVAETPTRESCGLPEDAFVFCCFNNTNKIRPDFFDIWMRLLDKVPGSVLWLLNKNKLVEGNLRREAKNRGIDPARLIFAPSMPHADHLARQKLADLFLDTLSYNAHTTASDALWAGLPLVTCTGDTFAGRVAASILKAVGMDELITDSRKEYEALALELAQKPKKLAAIKKKLEKNKAGSPLFDTTLYARHIEAAYIRMFDRWQAGDAPGAITAADILETAEEPKRKRWGLRARG